jgi:DNA-binding response OmpR family regulator
MCRSPGSTGSDQSSRRWPTSEAAEENEEMTDTRQLSHPGDVREGPALVLVIDDDCTFCEFLADCLELAGYEAIWSTNGLDGWQAFESQRPQLVVIDLDVPVISGFRLLSLLRSGAEPAAASVPVVVVTGHDMQEAMDVVAAARPDAYLQKPFEPAVFLQVVGDVLGRRAA